MEGRVPGHELNSFVYPQTQKLKREQGVVEDAATETWGLCSYHQLTGQLSPTLLSSSENGSAMQSAKLPALVGRQELLQSQPASRRWTLPCQFTPSC